MNSGNVHQTAVERLLFRRVVVILFAGVVLAEVEADRLVDIAFASWL